MQKRIDWCKDHVLSGFTLFLLAFIPLYPKIPLFDIAQTWVYIRIEDLLIALAVGSLILDRIIRKKKVSTPLTTPIGWYLGIGLLSLVNALLFIFPKFPAQLFPHLAFLHMLRRVEYFSVFFLAYTAFREHPFLRRAIQLLSATLVIIILYGLGQKFLGFPAFLTMNEEFAKGVPLRLPSTARIPSTFGGHYDLAAYLVFVLPIFGGLMFTGRTILSKIFYFILSVGGLILLLLTASRISFGVYLLGMSAMLVWMKKPWYVIPMVAISFLLLNVTSGASERFYKTFQVSNVVVDLSTGKPIGTLDSIEGSEVTLAKIATPDQESLPRGSGFINVPSATDTTVSSSSGQPGIETVTYYKKADLATGTGDIATISGSFLIQKALVYDISITTRFQGQWPRAIEAWKRNIFLGSGYSALSTAADGDYHRMLGETGILGAIAFLGIFGISFAYFFSIKERLPALERSFVIGVFGGVTALFVNALLIDVFEASKVALSLWMILGITLAIMVSHGLRERRYLHFLKKIFTHRLAIAIYLIGVVWFFWWKVFDVYFVADDFTWLRWAAESSVKDIGSYFTSANGFFYRPIPKLWYLLVFSIFWLKPFAYHAMSLMLVSAMTLLLYVISIRLGVRRFIAWMCAALFAVLSIHHENMFWISGQSSLLSAFFLTLALYLIIEVKGKFQKRTYILIGGAVGSILASQFSYEQAVLIPLSVALFAVWVLGKSKRYWYMLLLIPLYLLIRMASHAVPAGGDYGYKMTTFFVNSVGNSVLYITSIFGGPAVIEWGETMRANVKQFLLPLSVIGGIFSVGTLFYLWTHRKHIFHPIVILLIAGMISILPNIPMGGAAERYVFPLTIFSLLAVSLILQKLMKRIGIVGKILVILIFASVFYWNVREIDRMAFQWKTAGNVVERTMLAIKNETFPPRDTKNFFFINTPIRFGRAWIFPVGLTDAIWHMYRQSPFVVYTAANLEEAYRYTLKKGDREVFIFDGYDIKRGIREDKVVQPEKTP